MHTRSQSILKEISPEYSLELWELVMDRDLEGVPGLPGAPQDEAGLTRDQEGRRGSEEAVPGPSVFPSGEPGMSGDYWGSQEGCQGPSRPSGRNRGLPLRRRRGVVAAAAKSLQSCPTLCDPIDGSPPGSPIPGILQARVLEWFAISFFRASS